MKYLIIIIILLGFSANAYGYKTGEIIIYGTRTYTARVLIANKPKEWVLGLMFIKHLDKHAGLLMVIPTAKVAIWMKNMLIPIDCIYIFKNKVIKVYRHLPICKAKDCKKYYSGKLINAVLEINAGTAKEYGIRMGDEIKIKRGE